MPPAATLLVNKVHFPVTVLGPGRRIGIWLQGCRIRCKGCVSQDTWEFDPAHKMPVKDLADWCRHTITQAARTAQPINGITISGGEPFDQAKGLQALLDNLQKNGVRAAADILCYSGYPLATLEAQHPQLLASLDAIIPEPYVDALPLQHRWRGSSNQSLIPLSELGRARYAEHLDTPATKEMQVAAEGDKIWFIGLPGRGDMARLEALCRQRGIDFSSVSWRR